MPCDTTLRNPNQSLAQRMEEVSSALKRLENYLATGSVRLAIGPQGSVAFIGWANQDRSGLSDVCSVRSLMATNSWAFKQALMKAEQLSGRKINLGAVQAGIHSHNNGKTWQKH